MTCHSSNCFSIVWGQGDTPLVTSLPSSCYMTWVVAWLDGWTQMTGVGSTVIRLNLKSIILQSLTCLQNLNKNNDRKRLEF